MRRTDWYKEAGEGKVSEKLLGKCLVQDYLQDYLSDRSEYDPQRNEPSAMPP